MIMERLGDFNSKLKSVFYGIMLLLDGCDCYFHNVTEIILCLSWYSAEKKKLFKICLYSQVEKKIGIIIKQQRVSMLEIGMIYILRIWTTAKFGKKRSQYWDSLLGRTTDWILSQYHHNHGTYQRHSCPNIVVPI